VKCCYFVEIVLLLIHGPMSLSYLHFNIFGMALSDLATRPGSINERLASVYTSYLYKVDWNKDLEVIPLPYRRDFLLLKKIIWDDVGETVERTRLEFQKALPSVSYSKEDLAMMCNHKLVIKSLHWKTARKAAQLISDLYFGIDLELKDRSQ